MALKKQNFAEGEIAIFDEACVYKRGEYWQFRMWLAKENKYARKSLRTRSETTAVERGKAAYLEIYANLQQGKTYFSITTKEGNLSGNESEAHLELGQFGLKKNWLNISGISGHLNYRFYASHLQWDGYRNHSSTGKYVDAWKIPTADWARFRFDFHS